MTRPAGHIVLDRAFVRQFADTCRARHMAPIYAAIADAGIAFGFAIQGRTGKFSPPLASRPWVYILGDDLTISYGPDGFHLPSVKRLLKQATHTCVHSGAPLPEVYAGAAYMAGLGARVVIVETQLRHHGAWYDLVKQHAPRAGYLDVCPKPEGSA